MEKTKQQRPNASWWGGDEGVKVYANEHLTTKHQAILWEAKKHKEFFNVWS